MPSRSHGLTTKFPGSEYTAEEVEFMRAMDKYKREKRRPFPQWSEVLAVLRSLGWKKMPPPEA